MPLVRDLDDLESLVRAHRGLAVRYSKGWGDDRIAWVLTGRIVGRGPDCEPLLDDVRPVAQLAPETAGGGGARLPRAVPRGAGLHRLSRPSGRSSGSRRGGSLEATWMETFCA
ncbi:MULTISPECIES: DUF6098 family protein [Microbacterium]|uniref:DUF6098 family protein n=1 Tax=Microbacterium TaxID=33882 RepID=UPI00217D26D1|nr:MULTISPECIES: DUF6098 family protein [Microbacterium]